MHVKKYIERILASNSEDNEEKLVGYLCESIRKLKSYDKKAYEDLEEQLYVVLYGYSLNDELCEKWVENMQNNDGSKGEHWKIKDTTQVAQQVGIKFDENLTEYEWWAVMNMIYSDYYGTVPNDVLTYSKMAKAFVEDKDAKKGKLYRYYKCISK